MDVLLSLDASPCPTAGVIGQVVHNEAVLVLPERGEIKVLNEVGARIWSLTDGNRTVREIATIIGHEYDVALAQVEADTLAFLQELSERQLISCWGGQV
jgi:hypothetical protein